jgi:hypothetical protein
MVFHILFKTITHKTFNIFLFFLHSLSTLQSLLGVLPKMPQPLCNTLSQLKLHSGGSAHCMHKTGKLAVASGAAKQQVLLLLL